MKLIHGDCLGAMRLMPENSIDSVVTDPPAGISFMGKEWDSDKGGRDEWIKWMTEVMTEAYRVLKPGAHGLVWALPRTSHWTATALENAGFEVRDVVTHLFGTGFPKSLDISKAIDKAAGAEGPIVGKNPAYRARQLEHDTNWETAMRPEHKRGPATDAAKQWQGWGTSLKPASERWILIKKPDTYSSALSVTGELLGEFLCLMSPAKFAALISTSNQSVSTEAPSDFAQWLVVAFDTLKSLEQSELTAMFNSPETDEQFLSIVWLWNDILDGLCSQQNTFTTETKIKLTIELKTLNSLLSLIMPESTILAEMRQSGQSAPALNVIRLLSVSYQRLLLIHSLTVHESAGSRVTANPKSHEDHLAEGLVDLTGPLSEDYILIRKPLSEKTIAANVLKWGTGGINIDACRVEFKSETDRQSSVPGGKVSYTSESWGQQAGLKKDLQPKRQPSTGRFPANLILDEEAAAALDEQSGRLKSGEMKAGTKRANTAGYSGPMPRTTGGATFGDTGGASRFFYVAKASKADKGENNSHPTVKSTKLMEYLITLITPPGGVILDPFMGSGSTGVAALAEGFEFIGIELESEYLAIAKTRIQKEEITVL